MAQAKQREREQQRKERLLLGKTPSAAALLRGTSSNALAPAAAAGSAYDMSAARGDNFLAAHFQPQRSTSATSGRSPAMLSPRCVVLPRLELQQRSHTKISSLALRLSRPELTTLEEVS